MVRSKNRGVGVAIALKLVFISLWGLIWQGMTVKTCHAARRIDSYSGASQIFRTDYGPRQFAESYQKVELEGPPESPFLPEDSEAPEIWKYYRTARFAATYDSNIFKLRDDARDDVFFTYGLNLGMEKTRQNYYVRIFYDISYIDYIENEKSSGYDHFQTTEVGYRFDRVSINMSNTFDPRERIGVAQRTELGGPGDIIEPLTDHAHFDLNYDISAKTNATIFYNYSLVYFPDKSGNSDNVRFSQQSHGFGPRLNYHITPRTTIWGQYRWRVTQFLRDQEFKSWVEEPRIGIRTQLSPRMSFTFDIGYLMRDFKDDSVPLSEEFNWRAAIFRRITPKLAGSIYTTRSADADIDKLRSTTRTRISDTYGYTLTWQASPKINVYSDGSASFSTNEGDLRIGDTLTDSSEEFYRVSLGMDWRPRRNIVVFTEYEYAHQLSDFELEEYDGHRVVAGTEVGF